MPFLHPTSPSLRPIAKAIEFVCTRFISLWIFTLISLKRVIQRKTLQNSNILAFLELLPVSKVSFLLPDVPIYILSSEVYELFQHRQELRGSRKHFSGIKLHSILHMPEYIQLFGNVSNWDTDHFESAHKDKVKDLFRYSSKQISNIERELMLKVANHYLAAVNKTSSYSEL